jgi:hypothetical protein
VAALLLLLLLPLATVVPPLVALVLVTVVWAALHAYELVWWRQARVETRSTPASSGSESRRPPRRTGVERMRGARLESPTGGVVPLPIGLIVLSGGE